MRSPHCRPVGLWQSQGMSHKAYPMTFIGNPLATNSLSLSMYCLALLFMFIKAISLMTNKLTYCSGLNWEYLMDNGELNYKLQCQRMFRVSFELLFVITIFRGPQIKLVHVIVEGSLLGAWHICQKLHISHTCLPTAKTATAIIGQQMLHTNI